MSGTTVLTEKWPVLGRHEQAAAWLTVWTDLGRAPRTIDAYGRGLAEYLLMCEREDVDPVAANRSYIAVYVRELSSRPHRRGANVVSIDSRAGPANATIQQRLSSQITTNTCQRPVYPAETIEAHRAFIARRRSTRTSEEYRTPTEKEWDALLTHFEKRKVSIGTCGRAFSTPCVHEHACVRCALLRPDPDQRARLEEIRDNLIARIAEAEREGWLGEVEGLRVSLAGAEDKLAQITRSTARASVDLPVPKFREEP
ncbi:hypothetical protein [Embleya sp. NPDC059237]|uniref:hypothetical protein n=1 Tax=Embleya sp. NPDC059237 TaxID=3346784 RepID=UPI00367D3681